MRAFLKSSFISGALILVPVVLTFWILKGLILWCDEVFRSLIPRVVYPDWFARYDFPGIGLLFTLLLIFMIGILTRHYLGSRLVRLGDRLIGRIPFGRGIHGAIKQLLNALVSDRQKGFRQVVLVSFAEPDRFLLGFITGETPEIIQQHLALPTVTVFVPTAPNPTTGILFLLPREQVTLIPLPPEKALKFIVSCGTM